MKLIFLGNPVCDVHRSIGGNRQTDWPKVVIPFDDRLWDRLERNPSRLQHEFVDTMITPAADKQGATVILWKAVRLIADDA